jgi:hypothetical protein
MTVQIKSTSDCRSISSSVEGCHPTKKIRLQVKIPGGVEISIAFELFLYWVLYAVSTSLPAAFIIAFFKNSDDELPMMASTY